MGFGNVLQKDLPAKEGAFYIMSCPICRTSITRSDIENYWQPVDHILDFAFIESWCDKGRGPPGNTKSLFTDDEWQGIIAEQAKRGELFQLQKERGAIVEETAVALSLGAATVVDAGNCDTEREKAVPETVSATHEAVPEELPQTSTQQVGALSHRRAQSHGDLVSKFHSASPPQPSIPQAKVGSGPRPEQSRYHALLQKAFRNHPQTDRRAEASRTGEKSRHPDLGGSDFDQGKVGWDIWPRHF